MNYEDFDVFRPLVNLIEPIQVFLKTMYLL